MPTPSIQTLRTDAQQVLNLDSISAVRSVVAATLANANAGTPLNPNLTTQQLWNEFYQIVTQPKSDIESIIANQLMKFLYAPPAPGGVGADGQVIFNDGGVLAGDPQFLWNKTTNLLTVTGSATITGDLTVDTSTLKVDSTNNRVGIGTATPDNQLSVRAASVAVIDVRGGVGGAGALQISGNGTTLGTTSFDLIQNSVGAFVYQRDALPLFFNVNGSERYAISSAGVATWSNVGGVAGTAMTLNSTGLGVGGSPSYKLDVSGDLAVNGNENYVYLFSNYNVGSNARVRFRAVGAGGGSGYGGDFRISTRAANNAWNTDVLVVDNSGNLLVGTTSAVASGSTFENLGTARQVLTLKGNDPTSYTLGLWSATTTGDNFFAYFGTEASTTVRGSVTYNRAGGLVAYNTTSDYRAKDIIGPVSNSGSLIDSLKVYVGKMHGATIERPMLVAHEAQEVAPYAVSGTKDEVDADGKPKYQQMDASALVPLLIAEIKSLRARVQTLETR